MTTWDEFVTWLFNWCVQFLLDLGNLLGISYVEINIWVFCIIQPIVFLVMLAVIIWQCRKIKRLQKP